MILKTVAQRFSGAFAGLKACCATIALIIAAAASVASETQAPAAPQASQTPGLKGNAENGKQIYAKFGCYECHGYVGQGSSVGAKLAPNPMPFPAFARVVRKPLGVMPVYTAKVVTDQELADIHAFLSALPKPPDPATIPLLRDDSK